MVGRGRRRRRGRCRRRRPPGTPPGTDRAPHPRPRPGVRDARPGERAQPAFQRDIRGTTHRRGQGDPSSFWSWRTEMYAAASTYDPEGLYASTRACFEEMLASGVTSVGEFHYVHHQPDGTPYDDPNRLSEAVIAAARDVGLRLCLLEVLYQTSAPGVPPLPEQRRFCDADVTAYLRRCEALLERRGPHLRVGLAPHSVRAVSPGDLAEVASFAARHDLVVHAHVSEQPAENEACQAAHGGTPLSVFERAGLLGGPGRFTAVHAIHLDDADRRRLRGQQRLRLPHHRGGSRRRDPRGQRPARGRRRGVPRFRQQQPDRSLHRGPAPRAPRAPRDPGAAAPRRRRPTGGAGAARRGDRRGRARARHGVCGAARARVPFDAVALDLRHLSLRDVPATRRLDAIMLAGSAAPVRQVFVEGSPRL